MPNETRVAETILKSTADTSGFTRTHTELAKLRGDLDFTKQLGKQVAIAAPQMGDAIAKSANTGSRELFKLKTSFEQVKKAAQDAKLAALDIAEPDDIFGSGGGKGIRGSQDAIRLFGSKLRSLPSTQIPGLGIGTDAIANVIRLIGSVPPPLLAVGAAAAVVGAGMVALNVILGDSKSKLDAATVANKTYYDLIRDKTTSGELQAKIGDLAAKLAADQAELDTITKSFASGFENASNTVGDSGARILFALGNISNADDELTKRADELRTAIAKDSAELDTLSRAQGSAAIAANDLKAATEAAAKAEAELAKVRAQNIGKTDQARINAQIEAANLAVTGTEKQVQDRLDALAREKAVLLDNLPIMQRNLEQAAAGSEAQKVFQAQVDSTRARLAELDTTMLTLAGDTLQAAKANDLAAEAEKKRKDSIALVAKFNDDVLKINEQFAQKEVDLATKLADKQVEIAEKAAEDAAELLDKLNQKLADLGTDVNRDLAQDTRKANFDQFQAQVEFQRDEVAETKKHLQDLERIRRQAQQDEFEQGLDRDFAGLARSRRQTANQLAEANIQFNQDRQARLDAFKAKLEDDRNQYLFERQERIIQFEQDIADARAQYVRERLALLDNQRKQYAAAVAAYNRDLALLRTKHEAELKARDAEIRAELLLIQSGNNAKLQLEQQYYQQSLSILRSALGSVGGTSSASVNAGVSGTGAIGGIFGASAGRSTGSSSGGGATVSLSIPISISTGASAAQVQAIAPTVQRMVTSEVEGVLKQIFG